MREELTTGRLGLFRKLRRRISNLGTKLKGTGALAQLARGSGGGFMARGISAAISFYSTIVLTNYLGVSYGDYAYALNWLMVLVLLGRMGLNKAAVRYIAMYQGMQQWDMLHGFLKYCQSSTVKSSILIGGVSIGLTLLIRPLILDHYTGDFYYALIIALATLPFLGLLQMYEGVLDGFRKVFQSQIPLRMLRPGLIAVFLLAMAKWTTVPLNAQTGMWINMVAIALSLILSVYLVRVVVPSRTWDTPPKSDTREWFTTSRDMMLTSAFNLVLVQADIIMLGMLTTTTEVGIYSVATKIAQLLILALAATNAILHPIVADLFARKKHGQLQRIITVGANAVFAVSLLGALVLVLGSDYIVQIFGNENQSYASASPLLKILIIGQLVNSFAGPAILLLNMTGYQRDSAKIMAACAVINVILNVVLISLYGSIGAAIATATSTVIWNIAAAIVVWYRLKIGSIAFWKFKLIPPFERD